MDVQNAATDWSPPEPPETEARVITFRVTGVTETAILGVVPADGSEAVMPISEFYTRPAPEIDSVWMTTAIVTRPKLVVSTLRSDLLVSLFCGIVPEVRTGDVRIMGVARDPGRRAKVAVASVTDDVDAVAALVGRDAVWVRTVSRMLDGERIEVIAWHPDVATYISNALAPASVRAVTATRFGMQAEVSEAQMPAAVGDDGMNRQLVSELVGLDVTLRSSTPRMA